MKSGLSIEQGEGRLKLVGQLDHAGVCHALQLSRNWIAASSGLCQVDLGGVTRSESAGVALLLEWMRQAQRLDRRIEFLHPPQQLRALLKFFDLERVLPLRA